jgi:hypothetical protein
VDVATQNRRLTCKHKELNCRNFAEPSDGLEPSTPSLPARGNQSQPTATDLACFRGFGGRPICRCLPLVAPAGLHKRSILARRIPDARTGFAGRAFAGPSLTRFTLERGSTELERYRRRGRHDRPPHGLRLIKRMTGVPLREPDGVFRPVHHQYSWACQTSSASSKRPPGASRSDSSRPRDRQRREPRRTGISLASVARRSRSRPREAPRAPG